jgi:tape measure domain-containing protein
MAVSDLNVRIAVNFREFDRSMRQVEARMRKSAEQLRGMADGLSMSLTLPLIGIGAAAIKAAGDFETLDKALNTTMRNAGYTTEQAAAELERLRQIALAPGIDLEQAVKGSIRLQSVGFSAERARVTIAELANALAASGGSADQLDSVTRQFSQMSSKGRILQEDLSVILENMPGLAKTIKDTFGTISADALRDAGVSADEFIDKITQGLAKTERVQGGIANAVNNAQSALKQFFATIGTEINKVYNINEIADAFSETLGRLADYFRLLDPETKKSILNFALFAAALGPAIKVMQLFYSGGVAVVQGIRFMGDNFKVLSEKTSNAVAALQKMTVAQKALAAGTVIGAIALLAGAFVLLSDKIKNANTAYATLSEIRAKANEQVSTERAAIIPLIAILKDENATRDEKAKALGRLQEISPKYFANLDIEKLSIAELTKLQDQYIESLLRAARVKAAEEKLIELDKERIRLEEQKLRLTQKSTVAFQQATAGFGSYTALEKQSSAVKQELIADTDRALQSIKNQTDAVTGLIRANLDLPQTTNNVKNATGDLNKATDANTESTLKSAKAIKEQKDRYQELFDLMDETEARAIKLEAATRAYYDAVAIQRFQGNFGADPTAPSEGDIMSAFPQADQQTPGISFTNEQLSSLDELREKLKLTREEQEAFTYSTGDFFAMWKDGGEAQKAMTDSVLNSIQTLNSQGSASFQEYAAAAVSSALQVAKSMAIEGIFKAVSSAMKLPFPANIAAGALAAGAASALFNGLQSKIQPPKLAQGGLAYGPTLAMVGDNRMAGIDPEVIAPLSKLQDMLGGSQRVEVMGKISGRDLMLVMNKEVESTNRYR